MRLCEYGADLEAAHHRLEQCIPACMSAIPNRIPQHCGLHSVVQVVWRLASSSSLGGCTLLKLNASALLALRADDWTVRSHRTATVPAAQGL